MYKRQALIVFVASYDGDYLMAPGLPKRFFMWMGSRSYAAVSYTHLTLPTSDLV